MKYIIILVVLLQVTGCAMFQEEMLRSASKVQEAVDGYYCQASQASREAFRAEVNPTPDGNTIVVTCVGDQ